MLDRLIYTYKREDGKVSLSCNPPEGCEILDTSHYIEPEDPICYLRHMVTPIFSTKSAVTKHPEEFVEYRDYAREEREAELDDQIS